MRFPNRVFAVHAIVGMAVKSCTITNHKAAQTRHSVVVMADLFFPMATVKKIFPDCLTAMCEKYCYTVGKRKAAYAFMLKHNKK